jgi:serine/threonine protein kinase
MIPEAGQRFGPYEILGNLGGGGMGLVFRAWDGRLHREVALKILHSDYKMPSMRERFLQEARAASCLNHPNICTIFDIGDQDGNPYLVMELLDGETLKDRIAAGALTAAEIVRYAMEICDALTAAHSKGIVHRDIKPANIFLVKMPNGKRQAKVLDFGLAKIGLESGGGWKSRALDLTLAGATVGTVAYMSPEQARGESLDLRSDLFSLGVMLYEMATRRVPFEGATSAMMFVQLFNHAPEPVRNWNEAIPRDLERIILRLLAKSPSGRFQSARELHEDLGKIEGKLGRGGWLLKGPVLAVPLVRASDPVARRKGPRRDSGHRPDGPNGVATPGRDSSPSNGNLFHRAMRSAGPDQGSAAREKSHWAGAGALALDSGQIQKQPHTLFQAENRVNILDDVSAKANLEPPLVRTLPRDSVLVMSRSDAVESENGLQEIGQQGQFADGVEQHQEIKELVGAQPNRLRSRVRAGAMLLAMVSLLIGCFWLTRSGLFRPMVLSPGDRLLLTVIQNKTGDKTLDGTIMQGLEISLQQSKSLNILGGEAYRAGLRQVQAESGGEMTAVPWQRLAQKVGARAYLYGEITGTEAPYTIDVDVLSSDSNDKVASLEETAASREEIPAAIGRLAQSVRMEISADRRVDTRRSVPFDQEGTASLEALHAYALGEQALHDGRARDALVFLQKAAAIDPEFAQVQMRLAWLYRNENAEVASASAAEAARVAAAHASDKVKLLAQFCYEVNVSGDLVRAAQMIRDYTARYPHDIEGVEGLTRVLIAQGQLPEALLKAQTGVATDPFDADLVAESELAMIAMDHSDNALQLEAETERIGAVPGGTALMAGYLAGRKDTVSRQATGMHAAIRELASGVTVDDTQMTYARLYRYGLYLDNTGKMSSGLEAWRTSAAAAASVPQLTGTQAYLLAQGALDHALAESCTVALEMVNEGKNLPKGPVASFNAGMAAALCGDEHYAEKTAASLQETYPQNTAVTQYYVPELQAAAAIGVNEPERAMPTLIALAKYDQVSLTPYLRGMAHAALGQMSSAVLDFQEVLDHRGLESTFEGDAYPMAEIGIARVYASTRDKPDSVAAYRRFLALWEDADRNQALTIEASTKGK